MLASYITIVHLSKWRSQHCYVPFSKVNTWCRFQLICPLFFFILGQKPLVFDCDVSPVSSDLWQLLGHFLFYLALMFLRQTSQFYVMWNSPQCVPVWCLPNDESQVMIFWGEECHRDEVPFSSYHVREYMHVVLTWFWLFMLALIIWLQ